MREKIYTTDQFESLIPFMLIKEMEYDIQAGSDYATHEVSRIMQDFAQGKINIKKEYYNTLEDFIGNRYVGFENGQKYIDFLPQIIDLIDTYY